MARIPEYLEKTPKQKSAKQEKRAAKEYGGRVVAGSGSGREKADVNIKAGIKMEAKRTDKASISLKAEWLRKIEQEAFDARKKPALEIEIQDLQWVLIPKDDFLSYIEYVKEIENG